MVCKLKQENAIVIWKMNKNTWSNAFERSALGEAMSISFALSEKHLPTLSVSMSFHMVSLCRLHPIGSQTDGYAPFYKKGVFLEPDAFLNMESPLPLCLLSERQVKFYLWRRNLIMSRIN
jgi:hypothetical protein